MNSLTPILDVDQKTDIIDHVNQEHSEELLAMAQSHYQLGEVLTAKILDIFEEGVRVHISCKSETTTQEILIPFEIDGDLEDKILYLAYAAIVKLGSDFSGSRKRFFEVIAKREVTTNIIRLTIKSSAPLPEYYPGHAYAFLLKSMKKRAISHSEIKQKKPWSKKVFDHIFIRLMKHLSSKYRQKLLHSVNKDLRLYTLRKSWKSDASSSFNDLGYVDVFKHDDTLGSKWVSDLAVGDVILSRSDVKDKHPHLMNGRTVLIADETAYPAVAGIIEHWKNPLPPYIIWISTAENEQRYFEDCSLPAGAQVFRVICPAENQAEEVLSILERIENIDGVWAAFESESAKKVRHYLRNKRKLIGKNNHTKAYWKLKPKRHTH